MSAINTQFPTLQPFPMDLLPMVTGKKSKIDTALDKIAAFADSEQMKSAGFWEN